MQFPLLQAGRPFTGERAMISGVAYNPNPDDFWMRICRDAWKFYQEHPEGPYSYGAWDAIPGRSETRPTHFRWLKQYLPLVEEGTWAWLEVTDSNLFTEPLPTGVVASVFANREVYLVLANYGNTGVNIITRDSYLEVTGVGDAPRSQWSLPPRSLRVLRRNGSNA